MVWSRSSATIVLLLSFLVASLSIQAQTDYQDNPLPADEIRGDWEEATGDKVFFQKDIEPEESIEAPDRPDIDLSPPWWTLNGVKVFFILLIMALLIFIVYRLSLNQTPFNKNVSGFDATLIEDAERNIQESDLERLLRLALEAEDYRMALRVRYLMILQALDAKGWIKHKKNKTNLNYLGEMSGRPESVPFGELTSIFDYVWYADIPIPAEDDPFFAQRFGGFLKTIIDTKAA